MYSEYPGFQNWWRPVGDSVAEYLPEYCPVRLWPERPDPREPTEIRESTPDTRFFAWWVAPAN